MSPAVSTPTIASGAASSTAWNRASARSRSLKSRAVFAMAMIRPAVSVSVDTASDIVMILPSLRTGAGPRPQLVHIHDPVVTGPLD
jgi:hypothetical protein